MSHGGRVAAIMRARNRGDSDDKAPEELDATRFESLEDGNESGHAQKIVRELYQRYEKQLQRWRDYRKLFSFLFFVAWYLATLYMQRSANTAYMVHSTLSDVLNPGVTVMKTQDEVYIWLTKTLKAVWVDPVCGDGICESPWEFASYSSFGCQADCGKLQDVQKLTAIQVDLNWNFGHPLGSVPASDLMQQALWNLCPFQTVYSQNCYYGSDNVFLRLSDSASFPILDTPDGVWSLDVKRDIFDKIGGSVRSTSLIANASYYYKVYIAIASVLAEMDLESNLLMNAATQGNMSLFSWINYTLSANNTNATANDFTLRQIINATCACASEYNSTLPNQVLFGSLAYQALNQSMDPLNQGASGNIFGRNEFGVSVPVSVSTYTSTYCTNLTGTASPVIYEVVSYNVTIDNTTNATVPVGSPPVSVYYGPVPSPLPAGVTYKTLINQTQPAHNMTATCLSLIASSMTWRSTMLRRLQNFTIDWRLGNGQTTGKISARNKVFNQLQTYIVYNYSEMFTPVFSNPYGTGYTGSDVFNSRIDALQNYYVLGPYYYTNPMPASQSITRSSIYNNPNITTKAIASLAANRKIELDKIRGQTLNKITILPPSPKYSSKTLNQIVNQFLAAGAVNPLAWATVGASLPDSNSSALGDLRTEYNFVSWQGNSTGYLQCNLASRGPEYVGTCMTMNVTCTLSGTDNPPYNCTDISSPVASGTTAPAIPGNLTSADYRARCEFPCDRWQDCTTLCECWGSCKSNQICMCRACRGLKLDASEDVNFVDIVTGSNLVSPIASVAGVVQDAVSRRRLTQASTTELTQVLTEIGKVKDQQTSLQAQTQKLQTAVDLSNALAEARANDNTLIDLINKGQAEIKSNQAAVMSKLDVIIGQQNASLAAANQASAALSTIQGLASMQLAATQALQQAVLQQVTAIKSASYSRIISLTQALMLWKKARRDEALTTKAAKLATAPCTGNSPIIHNNFTLDNGRAPVPMTPRERNVGLTNRVIAGMLLHETRTNDTNCSDSKFNQIQQTCTGPLTNKAYGVDPTFKMSTASTPVTLYNPDFADGGGDNSIVSQFYNCDLLINSRNESIATYNIYVLNQTVNPYPYCAELFDQNALPYPFYYKPLANKPDGFPVFFDINLGAAGASTWNTYLQEGLYLDQHTTSLSAELITYNAPLRIFGYYRIDFDFNLGGSIDVTQRLDTVRVEMYNGYSDTVRLVMEIILNLMIFGMLILSVWQIIQTQREKHNFLLWFARGWNIIDFCSNALLTACMIIWWIFIYKYANTFTIQLRYDIYANINAAANYLALSGGSSSSAGMDAMWQDMSNMVSLVNMLNWYFALNGINILLLIARVLKMMDFQPRLGVVTRSLWLAGPDLIHFFIVASMVFIGYSMMAHLIFGNAIEKFQTFGTSVNTCFEILLGNIDVNNDLRALQGLQNVAGALFFWSYELLVFMVLLNFLLAIIVDAFSEVKERTHETAGVHTELYQLARDKIRSLFGLCSSSYISDNKLGLLLKQWAGEDMRAKAGTKEKTKLLTVLNEDLDEADLKTILLECLKDAPGGINDDNDGKGNPKDSSFMRRVFCLPGGKKIMATPREIELAAKYIIDRFGFAVEAEEANPAKGEEVKGKMEDAAKEVNDTGSYREEFFGGRSGPCTPTVDQDQLAYSLEHLAEVQKQLSEGQRSLMTGQRMLADQQSKLIVLMNEENKA